MSPIMRVTRGQTGSVAIEQLDTGERYRNPSQIERMRLLGLDPDDEKTQPQQNAPAPPAAYEPAKAPKANKPRKPTTSPKAEASQAPPQPSPETAADDEDDVLAELEAGLGPDPDLLEGELGDDVANEEQPPASPRSHPCPHCDFVAGSARGLAAHVKNRHAEAETSDGEE